MQLHEVTGLRVGREIDGRWVGQLSDGHGGFVAGVASCAVAAVFEDLVVQGLAISGAEVEVLEEGRDAGE